jgi:hypothetical protein
MPAKMICVPSTCHCHEMTKKSKHFLFEKTQRPVYQRCPQEISDGQSFRPKKLSISVFFGNKKIGNGKYFVFTRPTKQINKEFWNVRTLEGSCVHWLKYSFKLKWMCTKKNNFRLKKMRIYFFRTTSKKSLRNGTASTTKSGPRSSS